MKVDYFFKRLLVVVSGLVLFCGTGHAGLVQYNLSFGTTPNSLTGNIQFDDTSFNGTLTNSGQLTAFSFELNVNGNNYVLDSDNDSFTANFGGISFDSSGGIESTQYYLFNFSSGASWYDAVSAGVGFHFGVDTTNFVSGLGGGAIYTTVVAEGPTAPMPEPSIFALFGLGLVGIGFARRRQS